MIAARLLMALAIVTGLALIGPIVGPTDEQVPGAAVVVLIACAALAAAAAPLGRRSQMTPDPDARALEDAWIDTNQRTPHLHLSRRPALRWELHAVHIDQQGPRVRLRHLVNRIVQPDPTAPTTVAIRVVEERTFRGNDVVEASLALDAMREAAAEAEARSRTAALNRQERRERAELEARSRAEEQAARRLEVARQAELDRYRTELETRLARERAAEERRDGELEARGLAEALRQSRHPGPR